MLDENKINDITKNVEEFYNKQAEEFSKTRHTPWPGWNTCLYHIKQKFPQDKLSVLDIACGNGRFYEFLIENSDYEFDYLGLDNNDYMMIEALLKYQYASFSNFDVFHNLGDIETKYDVVAVFGFTHHIPSQEFRRRWFSSLINLLNPYGMLLMTFWDLNKDERFSKAEKAQDLEENDYYYGWGDSDDKRYVHIYTDEELQSIIDIFEQHDTKLIDTFSSDGKNNNLNRYLIFQHQP